MIEGILVRKTPFQDRHLIGDLILRNGKKQGVLFFGGMGGGKKVKPNNLEIGKLYSISFKTPIKGDLIQTKEWTLKWSHEKIRYDYWCFVLLSLICEISSQTAIPQEDLLNDNDSQYAGLFNVLSNGIFYLENNNIPQHDYHFISFFIGKFMADFGIFPQIEHCTDCENLLIKYAPSFFDLEKSGFTCGSCPLPEGESLDSEHLRLTLGLSKSLTWKNFNSGMDKLKINSEQVKQLMNYLIYQLNIDNNNLKTLSSLY